MHFSKRHLQSNHVNPTHSNNYVSEKYVSLIREKKIFPEISTTHLNMEIEKPGIAYSLLGMTTDMISPGEIWRKKHMPSQSYKGLNVGKGGRDK